MRITIESDERTTTTQTGAPGARPPGQEAASDAGASRALGEATGPGAEAGMETVAAGPPAAELVEAIAAAEAAGEHGAAASDASDAGAGPAG